MPSARSQNIVVDAEAVRKSPASDDFDNCRRRRKETLTSRLGTRDQSEHNELIQARSPRSESHVVSYIAVQTTLGCNFEILASFRFRDRDWLTVRQRLFADKNYRLLRFDAAEDFSIRAVIEAGLHRNFFGFAVGDAED